MVRRSIEPIPDRTDIAITAEKYFNKTGNAVEVGVHEGVFSDYNLRYWTGKYWMVDAWAHREGGGSDKNDVSEGHWDGILRTAIANTAHAGERAIIHRRLSPDCAKDFADDLFDWIYIDAGHDYDSVINDVKAWWPKLREGGLFSGDDYGSAGNDRWAARFGLFANIYNWGVIEAVNEFASVVGRQVHVTWLNDKSVPNWYIIK